MTQAFLFETDDIRSLQTVLSALIEIVGPRQVFYLCKEEPFGLTPDYTDHDFEIPPVIPVGDKWAIGEHDRTFCGAQFLKVGEIFSLPEEAAKAASDRCKIPLKSNMWISTISIRYSSPEKSEKMVRIFKNDIVAAVMGQVALADADKFMELCKPHIDDIMKWFDGSVGAGYRLKWAPDGGYDLLHICMIPVLYGK